VQLFLQISNMNIVANIVSFLKKSRKSHHFIDIFILRNNVLLIISLFLLKVTLRISE